MYILIIDTATEQSLLAIFHKEKALYLHTFAKGSKQSEQFIVAVQKALQKTELSIEVFSLIIVGNGPGSYTGTRVGITIAQALAYAHSIPLVPVCSLYGFVPLHEGTFAAMVDAKMGGIYCIKGEKTKSKVLFTSQPTLYSFEAAAKELQDISQIISPNVDFVQNKFSSLASQSTFQWVERAADATQLLHKGYAMHCQGINYLKQILPILYLRKTQAEIELEQKNKSN